MKKEELALAQQMIGGLEGPFDPAELKSEYRASLRELLEAKAEGYELPAVEPEPSRRSRDRPDGGPACLGRGRRQGRHGKEKPAATRKRAAAGK